MKIFIVSLIASSLLFSQVYEGCGDSKAEALEALTSTIFTKVENSFTQKTKLLQQNSQENVEQEITSYLSTNSSMNLQNIHYTKQSNQICASIDSKEQAKLLEALLTKALSYDEKNLPSQIDQKIIKVESWLKDIHSLIELIPIFLPSKSDKIALLEQKEKRFLDIYSSAIIQSKSLIFKACGDDKEEALEKLSQEIFHKKREQKGFFDSLTSLFSSKESDTFQKALELFNSKIIYSNEKNKTCAVIKKEIILNVAKQLYHDLEMFNEQSLAKDPKKRYDEISKLLTKIQTTQLLMKPFPKEFTKQDFSYLSSLYEKLQTIQKSTHPQSLYFKILNSQNSVVKLDGKIVQANKKLYIPTGEYSYEIKAKNRCSIKGTIELNKFDDEEIEVDFDEYKYPTLLFITDQNPSIAVNGISIKPNVQTSIPQCEGEVIAIAKYANQSIKEKIELEPNKNFQFELNFLTPDELKVFNNVQTKKFTTNVNEKISESLTNIASEHLHFSIEDDCEHGKIELDPRGSFIYTPKKDFVGKDSFSYVIKAENGKVSPKKIVIIYVKGKELTPVVPIDQNISKKVEKKIEETKKEIQKTFNEEKYQKFKAYILSLDPKKDALKIKKLAKKYPQYFQKFLEDMKNGN